MSRSKSCSKGCSRRRPIGIKTIISCIMVLMGVILIVYWLPVWIWFIVFGIGLIIFGIKVYL